MNLIAIVQPELSQCLAISHEPASMHETQPSKIHARALRIGVEHSVHLH
jgi:hypothetical protein